MITRTILSLLFLALTLQTALSKEPIMDDAASLSGFVKDKENGETLIGSTVFLTGTKFGARTNKQGYFSVNGISAGTYKVRVTFLGYKTLEKNITFSDKEEKRIDFELSPTSVITDAVTVEANRDVEDRSITISKVNIPVEQLREIRIGGEADVFRSLQFLPGVLTSSQISSGLFVRGGSPDQNLVLVDGATVYNPTHIFGFISTFNSEAIKDVELIKGGFQPEYGGRLSAVLTLTQKEGNKKEIEGAASLGVLSSRLNVEGPSPTGKGSWFFGGRRTYLELIKTFVPDDPEEPLPDFNFYDINGKWTENITDNDKISLSGFMSADNLFYDSFGIGLNLDLGNRLASLSWTHIFDEDLFSTVVLSGSSYFNNIGGDRSGYEFIIDNSIRDYSAKAQLEWFTNESITHKFGFEVNDYRFTLLQNFTGNTDSTAEGVGGATTNLTVDEVNYAGFAQVNYKLGGGFSTQAGLRLNYWQLSELLTFDPRLALRYQIFENIALKAAWGQFHQNLRLATQPDINIFDTWLPTDSTVPASYARHYIFSVETVPVFGYDLNFDIYYKESYNISEVNTNAFSGETVADVFYIGDSEAYGFEIFLQKKMGRLSGWVGYALGYITARFDSINQGREFRPRWDRRHDFKVVAQYELSENWDLGGSFIFQSGQSYTGASSRFQSRLPGQNYGRGKVVPTERYGLRLPNSHQLNLNASYNFNIGHFPSRVILDIYNVYNRRDIWFRNVDTQGDETVVEDVRLLPILPTLSFEMRF